MTRILEDLILEDHARVAELYADALACSARDTLLALEMRVLDGWTPEQHRYWVQTGEEPE